MSPTNGSSIPRPDQAPERIYHNSDGIQHIPFAQRTSTVSTANGISVSSPSQAPAGRTSPHAHTRPRLHPSTVTPE